MEVNQEQWQACRPGEIGALVQDLHKRMRRRQIRRMGAACASLLLALGTIWLVQNPASTAQPISKRLNCQEVLKLGRQYIAHELSPETEERVQSHLDNCPHCHERIERIRRQGQQSETLLEMTRDAITFGSAPDRQFRTSLRRWMNPYPPGRIGR